MTSGALIASIFLSGRVMQPVQRALGLWTRYQDYRVAKEKVEEIFSIPQQAGNAPQAPAILHGAEREGRLVLEDVGHNNLFHHVDLELKSGDCVQITGPYGCGKSTLLKIMAGLYMPSDGKVLVDGHAPQAYPPHALMNHVGLMATAGTIFRGRIRDNLTRFGTVPEDSVRPVTAMLGIDRDVARLPRGFDTWMDGVEQDTVPPGLRQRIALCAVLATRPRIILFDNAEHNLDREGYRQIHAMLGRLREQVAMVLVADDRNISSLAGRQLVLTHDGLRPVPVYGDTIIPFKDARS